ncbi:IucA/IucC family protein [Dyella silvatica]|uniref:IucA/IucC family protein n=1 Tax=Dyella silvatica TaxID=2992128 RepID=UPI0022598684|nr:IucA/IucC family protein [Dyella silvatica]
MYQQAMREQWFDGLAQQQAIACWLNCYLREFALPRGQAEMDYRGHNVPVGLLQGGGRLVRIRFAQPGYLLCVRVGRVSQLGRCDYRSAPYLKSPGESWRAADAHATTHFLLDRLAPECGFNAELLAQSANSLSITRELLGLAEQAEERGLVSTSDALIHAEQSMIWGHAMHPTPKSREGVDLQEVLACSPEARIAFPLYWFRIDPRLLRTYGHDTHATLTRISGEPNLYPCHPWEVDRLLANPLLRKAHALGWIEPLGMLGTALLPTSSVRTMYHPELDYFLKLSIHVRLTNCVRKNAWYELESAVALTQLLNPVWSDVRTHVPGFEVLVEPAATTLDFSPVGDDAAALCELTESFGMLYRDNVPALQRERYRPQVAGALFATDRHGISACQDILHRYIASHGGSYAHAVESWFEAYASLLLDGVWLAFFKHGAVLEPHLQNTMIGFDRGLPVRVWVRDLEGTKLVQELWPEQRLGELSERARASLHYPQDLGWKRVAYCALVNNLAEAIFHLCAADNAPRQHGLEARLWEIIAQIAQRWQQRFGQQPLLQGLLHGKAIPSKNNLRTRLFKRADRDSDYTDLPNPIGSRTAAREAT